MPFHRTAKGYEIGDFRFHGRAALPAGWLWCDGSAVSRATYAALFAAIGTAFGAGDGSTTFNVPDYRGRAPFGKDDMGGVAASRLTSGASGVAGNTLGATGGGETVTLTTTTIPAHAHSEVAPNGGGNGYTNTTNSGNTTQTTTSGSAGSGGAHQNVPPCQVCNVIVRAT